MKVSIVTPYYNRMATIEQTILSIFNQDYDDIEYIIVNDCSDETNTKYLTKMKERYPFIKLYNLEENVGQSEAMNKGWQYSSGLVVGYVSDDDVLKPNAISVLVNALSDDSEAVMVYPDCQLIDFQGAVLKESMYRPFSRKSLFYDFYCNVGVGALFYKSTYEKVGGWDCSFKLIPDIDFWARISSAGKCLFVDDVLAQQRTHGSSGSLTLFNPMFVKEFVFMVDKYKDTLVMNGIEKKKSYLAAYRMLLAASLLSFDFKNMLEALRGIKRHDGNAYDLAKSLRVYLSKLRSKYKSRKNFSSAP